jgi:hypothetical protein
LVGVLIAVSCQPVDAPDQNAQALSDLTGTPSVSAVTTATQGLIRGMRGTLTTQLYSRLGREGYNLDPGNPQNFPAYYTTLAEIGHWQGPYATIKLADLVIEPLDRVVGFSPEQRNGIRGFAKTVKAIQLLIVIQDTDVYGALPTRPPFHRHPGPNRFEGGDLREIFKLLDEAKAHLQASGSSFPFLLGSGFAGLTRRRRSSPSTGPSCAADIQLKNFSARSSISASRSSAPRRL